MLLAGRPLYHPLREFLHLLWPFLVLAVVVGELVVFPAFFLSHQQLLGVFVAAVLITHGHTVYGFLLIASSPRLRAWFQQTRVARGCLSLQTALVTIFFLFLALDLVARANPSLARVLDTLFLWATFHHTLWQRYGIGKTYDTNRVDPRWERLEKGCFHVQTAVFTVLLVGAEGLKARLGAQYGLWMVVALAVAPVLLLFALYVKEGRRLSFKWLFLSRTAFNLATVSYVARTFGAFVHGAEYIQFTDRMAKNLLNERGLLRFRILGAGLASVITMALALKIGEISRPLVNLTTENSVVLGLIKSVLFSFTLCHFYCDRILFRMRDSLTRSVIGPLIAIHPEHVSNKTQPAPRVFSEHGGRKWLRQREEQHDDQQVEGAR